MTDPDRSGQDMALVCFIPTGGRRPAFAAWWQRVQQRACWQREVHDVFSPQAREAMLARGREAWPVVAEILGLPPTPG